MINPKDKYESAADFNPFYEGYEEDFIAEGMKLTPPSADSRADPVLVAKKWDDDEQFDPFYEGYEEDFITEGMKLTPPSADSRADPVLVAKKWDENEQFDPFYEGYEEDFIAAAPKQPPAPSRADDDEQFDPFYEGYEEDFIAEGQKKPYEEAPVQVGTLPDGRPIYKLTEKEKKDMEASPFWRRRRALESVENFYSSYRDVLDKNPEEFAKKHTIAHQVGLPVHFLDDPDVYYEAQKTAGFIGQKPLINSLRANVLAWASQPDHMGLVWDDLDSLKRHDDVLNTWKYWELTEKLQRSDIDIAFQLGRSRAIEKYQAAGSNFSMGYLAGDAQTEKGMLGMKMLFGTATDRDLARIDELNFLIELNSPRDTGIFGSIVHGFGEVAGQKKDQIIKGVKYLPYAGIGVIATGLAIPTGGLSTVAGVTATGFLTTAIGASLTTGAVVSGFNSESGNAFLDFLDIKDEDGNSIDPDIARVGALVYGAGASVLEAVQLDTVFKIFPNAQQLFTKAGVKAMLQNKSVRQAIASFLKNYGKGLTSETATEVAQQGWQIIMRYGITAASNSLDGTEIKYQKADEVFSELWETAKGAMLEFSIPVMFGPGVNLVSDIRSARAALRNIKLFEALNDEAKASKLKERSPEVYGDFIGEVTKDGPVHEVGINGPAFAKYFQSVNMDPQQVADELGVADQYAESLEAGSDLVIPLETFAAKLAGTEHFKGLMNDLRIGDNAMTVNESLEFNERLKDEYYQLLNEQAESDAERQELEDVRESYRKQIEELGQTTDGSTPPASGHPLSKENIKQTADLYSILLAHGLAVAAKQRGMGVKEYAEAYGPVIRYDPEQGIVAEGAYSQRSETNLNPDSRVNVVSLKQVIKEDLSSEKLFDQVDALQQKGIRFSDELLNEIIDGKLDQDIDGILKKGIIMKLAEILPPSKTGEKGGRRVSYSIEAEPGRYYVPLYMDGKEIVARIDGTLSENGFEVTGITKEIERPANKSGATPSVRITELLDGINDSQGNSYMAGVKTMNARLAADEKAFGKKVDDYFAGKLKPEDQFKVMHTPIAMQLLNALPVDILTSTEILEKIFLGKHNLTAEVVKQLPSAIANPMMILDSETQNRDANAIMQEPRLVIVVDLKDENEATIVVPIVLTLDDSKTHFMLSAYSKADEETGEPSNEWFQSQINDGNLRYINSDKAKRLKIEVPKDKYKIMDSVGIRNIGLQLPNSVSAPSPSLSKIVYTEKALVNMRAQFNYKFYQEEQGKQKGTQTADRLKFSEAQEMERAGKSNEEIRKATGWFKGMEGTWRYEIPDSMETKSVPTKAWEGSPKVTQFSTIDNMRGTLGKTVVNKKHNELYIAAKAGSREAASELIRDIMEGGNKQQQKKRNDKLKALKEKHPNAILVAVHAEERAGRNAIPRALANYISKVIGLEVDDDIVQLDYVGRTGSDLEYRIAFHPKFDGEVQKDREYILVDDVVTVGGTFGALRHYIMSNGGKVVDMHTIGAAQYSTNIALSVETESGLRDKFGIESLNKFLKEVGIYDGNYEYLTEAEGRAILKTETLDAARDRILEARRKGSEQILQGSVQGREATNLNEQNTENIQGRPTEGGPDSFNQSGQNKSPLGAITFTDTGAIIDLFKNANKSTFLHEMGHYFLENLRRTSLMEAISGAGQVKNDWAAIAKWLKIEDIDISSFDERARRLGIAGIDVTGIVETKDKDTGRATEGGRPYFTRKDGKELSEYDQKRLRDAQERSPADFEKYVSDNKRWRSAHEMFAAGFEKYLMEGTAPTPELQSAFKEFMKWLINIYKDVKNIMYTDADGFSHEFDINDEVRGVMDRMLATDQEIEASRVMSNAKKLSDVLKNIGIPDDVAAKYKDLIEKSSDKAKAKLYKRLMADLVDEKKEELAEARKEARKQAVKEVWEMPEYRAFKALRTPLDKGGLRLNVTGLDEKLLKELPVGVVDNDGFEPDLAAEFLGYPSGEALLNDLKKVRVLPPQKLIEDKVKAATDPLIQLLKNPEKLKEEVDAALHNEDRAEWLAFEQEILREEATRVEKNINEAEGNEEREKERSEKREEKERAEEQAKQESKRSYQDWAENIAAKLKAYGLAAEKAFLDKSLRAARYVAKYLIAEQRAADNAYRAAVTGNLAAAAHYKDMELMNHAMYVEGVKIKERITKEEQYFKRFWPNNRLNKRLRGVIGEEFFDQIIGLLYRAGLKSDDPASKSRPRLVDFVNKIKAEKEIDLPIAQWILDLDVRGSVLNSSELSVSQFLDVADAARMIEQIGRNENRLLTEQRNINFNEVVNDLGAATLAEHGEQMPRSSDPNQKFPGLFKAMTATLDRVETLLRMTDGFKEQGVWWSTFYKPTQRAYVAEIEMAKKAKADIDAIFKKHFGGPDRDAFAKFMNTEFDTGLVDFATGKNIHWTGEQLLSAMLNWGTERNRERLVFGQALHGLGLEAAFDNETQYYQAFQVGQAAAEGVFRRLATDKHWAFVQDVWDMLDGFWPDITKLEKEMTGVTPEKSEALTVKTAGGSKFRGGYYPIRFDSRLNWKSFVSDEKETNKALYESQGIRAHTKHGHTKERVDFVVGRPLLLSLSVIDEHVGNVVHDLTHRPLVRDLTKLIQDDRVRGMLTHAIGSEGFKQFNPWIQGIAASPRITDATDMFVTKLMGKSAVVQLAINVISIIGQTVSIVPAAFKLGPTATVKAVVNMLTLRPFWDSKFRNDAFKLSPELEDRLNGTDRNIRAALDLARRDRKGRFLDEVNAALYVGMGWADMWVSMSVWSAAYDKGLKMFGGDQLKAVDHADYIVRTTNNAGAAKDLAQIQRGSPFKKFFTMYYSAFGSQYQLFHEEMVRAGRGGIPDKLRLAAFCFMVFTVQAALEDLIKGRSPFGGDDDEPENEEIVKWLLLGSIGNFSAMFPGVRDVVSGYGYRPSPALEAGRAANRALSNIGSNVWDSIWGRDEDIEVEKTAKSLFDAGGYMFGLPTTQLSRWARTFMRWVNNEPDFSPWEIIWSKRK